MWLACSYQLGRLMSVSNTVQGICQALSQVWEHDLCCLCMIIACCVLQLCVVLCPGCSKYSLPKGKGPIQLLPAVPILRYIHSACSKLEMSEGVCTDLARTTNK